MRTVDEPWLHEKLEEIIGPVKSMETVHGGDINTCFFVDSEEGYFFLKTNSGRDYPNMFRAEAKGLDVLRRSGFRIPDMRWVDSDFLLLEWIYEEGVSSDYWANLGYTLAEMHSITREKFGLDHSNYIGTLWQWNNDHEDWAEFYIKERLKPQVKLARMMGRISLTFERKMEKLYEIIPAHFNGSVPAMIHGDFWNGNVMCAGGDTPCLYDPATYFGVPEMDLAMSRLFGGFSVDMYEAYYERKPAEPGHEDRINLCSIYPLMVHVNLFGGVYLSQANAVMSKFTD